MVQIWKSTIWVDKRCRVGTFVPLIEGFSEEKLVFANAVFASTTLLRVCSPLNLDMFWLPRHGHTNAYLLIDWSWSFLLPGLTGVVLDVLDPSISCFDSPGMDMECLIANWLKLYLPTAWQGLYWQDVLEALNITLCERFKEDSLVKLELKNTLTNNQERWYYQVLL